MFYVILQIGIFLLALLLLVKPLGLYMANVYQGNRTFLTPVLQPVENLIYKLAGVRNAHEMDWKTYAVAMLIFNIAGLLLVYILQRVQAILPLNPQGLAPVPAGPGLQFGHKLRYKYELAKLRRRDHYELSYSNARHSQSRTFLPQQPAWQSSSPSSGLSSGIRRLRSATFGWI